MAQITQRQLSEIRRALGKMDAATDKIVTDVIQEVGLADVETLRNALMERARPIARISANNAERVARAAYNAMRMAGVGKTMVTESANSWDGGKFDAAVNTAVKKAGEGATAEQVANVLKGRMRYDNRRAYGETIRRNASIDPLKPRYARVPGTTASYADGCPFCRMLASRGFVYYSKRTAGEFDHYHADCSCTVVASWDENPSVEGYDIDALRDEYELARSYAESQGVGAVGAKDVSSAYRSLGLVGKPSGSSPGFVDYANPPKNVALEKSWSELEDHEKAGVWHLSNAGFNDVIVPREDPSAPANIDFKIGSRYWEMKNVTNHGSSISNQIKRARIKWYKTRRSDSMRVVITTEGYEGQIEKVNEGVLKRLRPGETALVFDKYGNYTKLKK